MNEADIRRCYFSDARLRRNADEPLIDSFGEVRLYGRDERLDLFELPDTPLGKLHKRLAASTVIINNANRLGEAPDGSWTLKVKDFRHNNRPPCATEKFKHQKVGGWCSGFMAGDDIIVTAGHSGVTEFNVETTAYIFGYHAASGSDPGPNKFSSDQVYFGKELVFCEHSPAGDFAVIRVDRPIITPEAEPLTLRTTGMPVVGQPLGLIGYPSGLPVKIAFGNSTTLLDNEGPWLKSNLDAYGVNSGSPVFNEDGLVEGILVAGATDYEVSGGCFRSLTFMDSQGSEVMTASHVFREKIPS